MFNERLACVRYTNLSQPIYKCVCACLCFGLVIYVRSTPFGFHIISEFKTISPMKGFTLTIYIQRSYNINCIFSYFSHFFLIIFSARFAFARNHKNAKHSVARFGAKIASASTKIAQKTNVTHKINQATLADANMHTHTHIHTSVPIYANMNTCGETHSITPTGRWAPAMCAHICIFPYTCVCVC